MAQIKIESHFPREILANRISVAYGTHDRLVVDSTKHKYESNCLVLRKKRSLNQTQGTSVSLFQ